METFAIKYNPNNVVLFLLIIFVLISCNHKKQDTVYSEESNTISALVLKAYKSINKGTFFEICQILNDSIQNRTDCYISLSATTNIFVIDGTIEVIRLGFMEHNKSLPPIRDRIVFDICIKNEKTFVQYEQANINNLKEQAKKYIFEPDSLDKYVALRKRYTDSFGEVEVSKVGVILSMNAKENKLSSNEWLLFFKCLHIMVDIFEEERDNLSIKLTGKNFNSLTFEQKEAISDIAGYNIILIFDEKGLCSVQLTH